MRNTARSNIRNSTTSVTSTAESPPPKHCISSTPKRMPTSQLPVGKQRAIVPRLVVLPHRQSLSHRSNGRCHRLSNPISVPPARSSFRATPHRPPYRRAHPSRVSSEIAPKARSTSERDQPTSSSAILEVRLRIALGPANPRYTSIWEATARMRRNGSMLAALTHPISLGRDL